jgi:hypothetical protein
MVPDLERTARIEVWNLNFGEDDSGASSGHDSPEVVVCATL